jgi:serine/threonine-protein kinase
VKLLDWLRGRRVPQGELAPAPSSTDRARLEAKLQTARADTRLEADDWAAIDRLLAQAREHDVIEVLRRWIATRPSDLDATLRLCELLCGRLEHQAARPLLERLVPSTPHRLRALLLLGEAAERAGDLEAARRSYERVLALDLDHVRARAAADRLRPARSEAPRDEAATQAVELKIPVGARYRIERELGRGGSGAVYLAEDTEIGRPVALKILHPRTSGPGDDQLRLRAWEEARVAASLRQPGVPALYDLDEERRLIAMELCRGGALRDRLRLGALAPREALGALAQLAGVLAAAHARGIVHGDVKPANLLLRRVLSPSAPPLADDELALCDFGIARLAEGGENVEQRALFGTLAYMAPEQWHGAAGPAADLYAAGVVALELFGGVLPRGDRAAYLRGEVRPEAGLPPATTVALGPLAAEVTALLSALLSVDPVARPSASETERRAATLVERIVPA